MANTAELTAAPVMDAAAALLNDASKTVYPYSVQIPYLNMALRDLQEIFEQNEIPVVATTSAVISVPSGVGGGITEIVFANPHLNTNLPDDLIEPSVLWERQAGIDPYIPMTKVDFLDLTLTGQEINQFLQYVWEEQKIKVFTASQNNEIRMNYIRNLFMTVTASTDSINVINAMSYLQYRTARHLAIYIAENPTRARDLDNDAGEALDKVLGIGTKGRQNIMTRRRPFRSGWKNGGSY